MEQSQTRFNKNKHLSDENLKLFDFAWQRIDDLKNVRKESHYGTRLEPLWSDADKDYVPHKLRATGKRVIAEDEEKGWRGAMVELGKTDDWQSDVAYANPYLKINAALSVLIDRNPAAVFSPGSKKYEETSLLMKQLYQRSWETAKSKQQLKLFVYNLAKYGWACARTYPLKLNRKVKVLTHYDEDEPKNNKYETKEVTEFNDIFRENLDPWNTWIDDMAEPNNEYSLRDWAGRKVYSMDAAKEEFGQYPLWKYVVKGGITEEHEGKAPKKKFSDRELVEVYFYENRLKDVLMVIANGVPIIIEPLPISDSEGVKKLSLWHTYWSLRHAKSPYGIGIYEAIRNDSSLLDRIRNMTIDQVTLSIYKMFFYQGTQSLTESGDIKIAPGKGKQVIDPKNINWLDVPGPGKDAYQLIDMFKKDMDDISGVTEPLMGQITGKTAFEIAQAKEAALKRMKMPLENITEALESEAYVTIYAMQLLYSIPEVERIADPNKIDAYLKEIESNRELYRWEGEGEDQAFEALKFREVPINLGEDEQGNLTETEDTKFFKLKPELLKWEGVINVKGESVLTPSKQINKALELEMYNMLLPLLSGIQQERMMLMQTGQPPTLNELTHGKAVQNLVKLYDKDPKEILPDSWFAEPEEKEEPLFVGAEGGMPGGMPPGGPEMPPGAPLPPEMGQEAQKMTGEVTAPQQPQGIVGKMVGKLSAPFRKI
jgi:hypothetical protein